MKNIKCLAFDLDDTLTVSKTKANKRIIDVLSNLIRKYNCYFSIISGSKFDQIYNQILKYFDKELFNNFIIFPLLGGELYSYKNGKFVKNKLVVDISKHTFNKVSKRIRTLACENDIWCENPNGVIIEHRGVQITYSALGQNASYKDKKEWNAKHSKTKKKLAKQIQKEFPDLSVKLGGITSIDISDPNISKEFAIKTLLKKYKLSKSEVIFFGDNFKKDGNDYPVIKTGVKIKKVKCWQDTYKILSLLL